MIDFGLGRLRLWSAAAACAGLFMTQAATRSRSKVLADCAIPWQFDSTAMSGEFP